MRILMVVFTLFVVQFQLFVTNDLSAETSKKRVLLLHSYQFSFPTFNYAVNAFVEEFTEDDYVIDIQAMNTKMYNQPGYLEKFYNIFEYKFNNTDPYDLVFLAEDNAFNFYLKYQKSLFKNVPAVFFGVNDAQKAFEQNDNPYCTGLIEKVTIVESIEFAKKLNPKLSLIISIFDNTVSGKLDALNFKHDTKGITDINFQEINLSSYSYKELVDSIKKIDGDNVAIFYSAGYVDKDNHYMSFSQSLSLVIKSAKVPVYYMAYQGLDKGAVGGKLVYHYLDAKEAINIGKQILEEGASIENIRVTDKVHNKFYANFEAIQKHSLKIENLPSDVIIVNKPDSSFKITRPVAYLTTGVLIGLAILIIVSLYFLRKNRKTRFELEHAKNRAEESDKLKTAFLCNISHEVRTPLNAILGFSEILGEPDTPEIEKQKMISIIRSSGQQLLSIINDILDISMIELNQIKIENTEFNVNDAINEAIEECKHHETYSFKNNIDLIFKLPENESNSFMIYADSLRFKQILSNLINNSIKFTEEGFIEVGYSYVNEDGESKIEVYVKDTGIGIAKEKGDFIFKRFGQLDDDRLNEGTGLGLSICKGLLELMGGDIRFSSTKNVGTTFYVTLPVNQYR